MMGIDRGVKDKTGVSDVHFSEQSQEPQDVMAPIVAADWRC